MLFLWCGVLCDNGDTTANLLCICSTAMSCHVRSLRNETLVAEQSPPTVISGLSLSKHYNLRQRRHNLQGGAIKTGPPSHCKYSEIP